MKKKLSILIVFVIVFSLLIPQNIFADDETDANTYQGRFNRNGIILLGGPQAASDTSIKISWLDMVGYKGYKICWKEAGGAEEDSVILENTSADSYIIKGLKPKTKYEIKIKGIIKGIEQDLYTEAERYEHTIADGYTYVKEPSYVYGTRISSKDYIEMTWNIHEKDAILQIYRSDKEDGSYELVGSASGTEEEQQKLNKYGLGQVIFRDDSVVGGKTYYYKAKSVLQTEDGTQESEFSEVAEFESKNMKLPIFSSKMINKRGVYSKSITWKFTSDQTNYRVYLGKRSNTGSAADLYTYNSSNGKRVKRAIKSVEYSYNGKKYYKLKAGVRTAPVEPGKPIYLRINTKSKVWIRKDGKGFANFEVDNVEPYYMNYFNNSVDLHFNGTNTMHAEEYPSDEQGPDDLKGYLELLLEKFQNKEAVNKAFYGSSADSTTVSLRWDLVPLAKKYALRYGKTKEEAINSKPIILPCYQAEYEIEGLEENNDYCFLLTDLREGDSLDTYIGERTSEYFVRVASRPFLLH